MRLSNKLSCEDGSFSCCRLNLHGCFHSEVWGFISPRWSPGLCGLLHSPAIPPSLSMQECGATGSASCPTACPVPLPAAALLWVLSAPAAQLRSSYWSGWMFLLYLLGCQTSISSIFCQFWLFFVFKLLLSFFWLCEGAQCVYLCLHLGFAPPLLFFTLFEYELKKLYLFGVSSISWVAFSFFWMVYNLTNWGCWY